MPINSGLKNFEPARQVFRREITLLSGGYYDRKALPGGRITVFPWDVDVDAWLQQRRRESKFSSVLWELATKVSNLNGCPVEKLPLGDVNTILLVARSITNDSQVEYAPTCTKCGMLNEKVVVKIPDDLTRIGEKGPEYPGWDEFVLPKSNDVVRLRPYTVGDEVQITSRTDEQRKKLPDRMMRICLPIVSIGGGAPDHVDELMGWWNALHPKDRKEFLRNQDNLYPHLDTDLEHVCDVCGAKFVYTLNVDTEFFH